MSSPDTILLYRKPIAQSMTTAVLEDGEAAPRRLERSLTPLCGWRARIRSGATRGSKVRWLTSVTRSPRNTVKRILQDHGIDPASERRQRTPGRRSCRHRAGLAAADFFTVEVLTLAGLKRAPCVLRDRVGNAPRTDRRHPPRADGAWVAQMARTLTDPVDGFLRTARYLIHDRDPCTPVLLPTS